MGPEKAALPTAECSTAVETFTALNNICNYDMCNIGYTATKGCRGFLSLVLGDITASSFGASMACGSLLATRLAAGYRRNTRPIMRHIWKQCSPKGMLHW